MNYFDKPTQVQFIDDEDNVCYGIAFQDNIICACCGSIFPIDEITIIASLEWVNFEEEIKQ